MLRGGWISRAARPASGAVAIPLVPVLQQNAAGIGGAELPATSDAHSMQVLKKNIKGNIDVVVNAGMTVSFALEIRGEDPDRPDEVRTITGLSPEVARLLLTVDWVSMSSEDMPDL